MSTIADLTAKLKAASDEEARQHAAQVLRAAIEDLVRRLERCRALLVAGFRSEAIRHAELPPPLLDEAVSALQPDIVTLMQDFGGMPGLDQETLRSVNEAYTDEQRLNKLLRQYRYKCLRRASLPERLQSVYQLLEADLQNALWSAESASLQKAFLPQVSNAISEARSVHDHRTVRLIYELLTSPHWSAPTPDTIKTLVADAYRASMREEMQRTLLRRFKIIAHDVKTGKADAALEKINAIKRDIAFCDFALPPDLQGSWGKMLAWEKRELQKRDIQAQRQQLLQDFESAIQNNAPVEQAEELLRRAERLGLEIPKDMIERYKSVLYRKERVLERTVTCVVLVAIAATGVVLLAIMLLSAR